MALTQRKEKLRQISAWRAARRVRKISISLSLKCQHPACNAIFEQHHFDYGWETTWRCSNMVASRDLRALRQELSY